jgi:hypothetical protein
MSKGRVWNKGKRNGGGGPPGGNKTKKPATESIEVVVDPRINTIERMNRENWVVRPARAIPENTNNESTKNNKPQQS